MPDTDPAGAIVQVPIKSVDKAIEILECYLSGSEVLRVNEVSAMTRLNRSTVSRVMATLEKRGWLERDSEPGSYRLGIKVNLLGSVALNTFNLPFLARPVMERLRDYCGEEVALYVLRGNARICVAKADSKFAVAKVSITGNPLPLHCGAAGKVLLAYLPEDKRKQLIYSTPLQAFTPSTITDPEELEQNLKQIREQGYAISKGEREVGAYSIVAPVRDVRGNVVASLAISGPIFRLSEEQSQEYVAAVVEAANEISVRLGCPEQKAVIVGQ